MILIRAASVCAFLLSVLSATSFAQEFVGNETTRPDKKYAELQLALDEAQSQISILSSNNETLRTQLSLLQERLEATQRRYDNEKVSRLLAEKNLQLSRNRADIVREQASASSRKLQFLLKQLEENQQLIRQLRADLAAKN